MSNFFSGKLLLGLYLLFQAIKLYQCVLISTEQWNTFWNNYHNLYETSTTPKTYVQYFFQYNSKLVTQLNRNRGSLTYDLATNQFSGMNIAQFNALFPPAPKQIEGTGSPPQTINVVTPQFDLRENVLSQTIIEDQGITCNSGWAYAVAKSLEIKNSIIAGGTIEIASAQQLINCAGGVNGCKNQVPQTAFDYLHKFGQTLYSTTIFPNEDIFNGMCILPDAQLNPAPGLYPFNGYNCIPNSSQAAIKQAIVDESPVVIEIDPTSFDFMHYSSGIFQQPLKLKGGSHFMIAIGYDSDTAKSLDYWIVMNSFGETWGEKGFMKLAMNTQLKSACFPY